jgi:predicted ATP-grasp superfamily ATP-dependent carboligase
MRVDLDRRRASGHNGDGPLAFVLGEIDLLRALHIGGVPCAVAATPGDPARYSRAASQVIRRVHAAQDSDELLRQLVAFAADQHEPPVLFYDGDWDLLFISRHREQLSSAFRFTIAEARLVESLVDKHLFQELAARLELPVPASRLLRAGAGVPDNLELRFPLIVKPLTRNLHAWRAVTNYKAVFVEERAALEALAATLERHHTDALIQEAIVGGEDRIESYHCYVDESGDIAGEFTGRKLRTFPVEFGYSTALTTTDEDDVRALGRSVVRDLGLTGVAKLDFKRDPKGLLWLLEVNPRFNLWHHLGAVAGVNLPRIVYADLVGLPRPPAGLVRPGMTWCVLRDDFRAARAQQLSLRRWAGFVARCEAISGFAWEDPAPLARAVLARAGRAMKTTVARPLSRADRRQDGHSNAQT